MTLRSSAQQRVPRKQLEIDLSPIAWFSPLGVVALLATYLHVASREVAVTCVLPESRVVRTCLERIGFLAELERQGWSVDGDLDVDQNALIGACLQVSPLTTPLQIDRAADQLHLALFEAKIAGNLFEDLLTVAVELTQNAREHGSPCYVVAQTHTGRTSGTPGVHIAVADFGEGFGRTLAGRYGHMSEGEAVCRGFEERVTSTGESNRGLGLGYVAEAIDRSTRNSLQIISPSAHVTRSKGGFDVVEGPDYRGTLASAYFRHTPAKL